ncbi:hypothetical protein MSG28_011473 [Choristoneura fumiferana]|uniref:Uncharacterized protein n=1 Tax=Choristoneura fumiferana TaxID=7141 RepID=A0ACC0JNI5_CHOFU|nr:hypothetical protein MSG28_011473 [Choristoneura fumiferana]
MISFGFHKSYSTEAHPKERDCTPLDVPAWINSSQGREPYFQPGYSGPGVKAMAILNCLLARQLCFEDASCSAILEIIPRVCGSELDFDAGDCTS